MPTLDDLPILSVVDAPTGDDLIPLSDLTASASSKVKAVRLNQINGLSPTDITTAAAGSITVSTRMLVISSGSTSTITLPAASGALREIFIINDAVGTATLPTLAAGLEAISTNDTAHLLSNGTGWYRA